jgi:hypothetical protein
MGELHGGGRPGDEEDDVVGGGEDLVRETASASFDSGVSSGSPCSSTMSSRTDDDAESSPAVGDRACSSSSGEDTMQLDEESSGPLYELSPLLAHLPVRYVDLNHIFCWLHACHHNISQFPTCDKRS